MTDTFTLLTDDELDPSARELLERLPRLNVIRAAAGAPTVLPAFVDMATALLAHTQLPAPEREVAVLRPAHNAGSRYVWHQHERISHLLGMAPERIAAARDGGETEADRLLCRAADELTAGALQPSTRQELLSRFGYRQTMELILILGWFGLIIRLAESLGVEIEDAPAFGPEALDHYSQP